MKFYINDIRHALRVAERATAHTQCSNAEHATLLSELVAICEAQARHSDSTASQVYFDGKVAKITSVLASLATYEFNKLAVELMPEQARRPALFDCRVWNVPTRTEAVNVLVWREQDATRNSIQMAGQAHFSHKQLHGVDCDQIQEMLFTQVGINWNDYPAFFKRGTYVQRRKVTRAFDATELERLPPKHEARSNPGLLVERSEVSAIEMPPILRVTNRVSVVFDGEAPVKESKAEGET